MKQLSSARSDDIQPQARSIGTFSDRAGRTVGEETERAILKTVLYSDLFDYPLTSAEIAHYLVEIPCTEAEIEAVLLTPAWLQERVSQREGYITLRGRESIVAGRRDRFRASDRLWRKARFFARILSNLPFIRLVAVTGALAMHNSNERDDVDLFIVTAPSRVWLARALAVAVVYAGKLTPNTLCPNYVLSQAALSLEPRTVYVAHEFVQMVPLYGCDVYDTIRSANPWIHEILPNAGRPLHGEAEYRPGKAARGVKRALEYLLSGALGDWIEAWEMKRKIRKFAVRKASAGNSVILDRNQVKGHFDDHGARVSTRYQKQLEEYQLQVPGRV